MKYPLTPSDHFAHASTKTRFTPFDYPNHVHKLRPHPILTCNNSKNEHRASNSNSKKFIENTQHIKTHSTFHYRSRRGKIVNKTYPGSFRIISMRNSQTREKHVMASARISEPGIFFFARIPACVTILSPWKYSLGRDVKRLHVLTFISSAHR